jgi:hypothetical protein
MIFTRYPSQARYNHWQIHTRPTTDSTYTSHVYTTRMKAARANTLIRPVYTPHPLSIRVQLHSTPRHIPRLAQRLAWRVYQLWCRANQSNAWRRRSGSRGPEDRVRNPRMHKGHDSDHDAWMCCGPTRQRSKAHGLMLALCGLAQGAEGRGVLRRGEEEV